VPLVWHRGRRFRAHIRLANQVAFFSPLAPLTGSWRGEGGEKCEPPTRTVKLPTHFLDAPDFDSRPRSAMARLDPLHQSVWLRPSVARPRWVLCALSRNAVKHFLTRKMAYERIVAEFVRIRNARKSSEFSRIRLRNHPNSHEFGYENIRILTNSATKSSEFSRIRLRKCFTALPFAAKVNRQWFRPAVLG
jgi:hypothetical protein